MQQRFTVNAELAVTHTVLLTGWATSLNLSPFTALCNFSVVAGRKSREFFRHLVRGCDSV
jgi:hypothetical protein